MYRFLASPRWILFHLAVIVVVGVMVNLGFWQLRRLDERRAFNAQVTEHAGAVAVPIGELLPNDADDRAAIENVEWRPVVATGTYLPDETVNVVNRSVKGRAGELVVTPLALHDGSIVLVERGFVALGSEADIAPPPEGEVTVTGRLRSSQERRRGQLTDPAEGDLTEVHRIDIARLSPQLPGPVAPMYVEAVSSDPAERGDAPRPVPLPELTEGPHLSYAVQWYIFSVCAIGGWVLAVRHSIGTRRAAQD